MDLKEYLGSKRLIIDGSMGTYYSLKKSSSSLMSEYANITEPEIIQNIHKDYIRAGATLIKTNTFAANIWALKMEKEERTNIIKAACNNAREAALEFSNQELLIAADFGPISDTMNRNEAEVLQEYKEICDVFLKENLAIFFFETFSDNRYIIPISSYIKEKRPDSFILVSYCVNKFGYTASFAHISRLFQEVAEVKEIDACGLNCGIGPGHMYSVIKNLTFPEEKYSFIAPNTSYPEQIQNRMVFHDNIKYYQENLEKIAKLGIHILGGCCGTTPEYIKSIKELHLEKVIDGNEVVSALNVTQTKAVKENAFYEKLKAKKVIAVELDPPYDARIEMVMECSARLKEQGVDIITFADSPMGRSRIDSILMGIKVAQELDIPVMPHVCCRDKNMIAMRSGILGAYINKVRNVLIVTGDPVPVENRSATTGVFDYSSIRLMEYISEMNKEHFNEDPIVFGGALNYARGKLENVVDRMQKKVDAGAKFFLTQPIFSQEDVNRIKEIKKRIDTKILCGIMPLVSYRNANFIRNEITGINVPQEIVDRFHTNMSKEEGEMVGAKLAVELMEALDECADGYYFMLPFNRVSLIDKINKMKEENGEYYEK